MEIMPCKTVCIMCKAKNGLVFCNYSRFHKICLACAETTSLDNKFKCQLCNVLVKITFYSISEQEKSLLNSSPSIQITPSKDSGKLSCSDSSDKQQLKYNLSQSNPLPHLEFKYPENPTKIEINKVETLLESKNNSYSHNLDPKKQSEATSVEKNPSLPNQSSLIKTYEKVKINRKQDQDKQETIIKMA